MSGYHSTDLIVATVQRPAGELLTALRDYFTAEHRMKESKSYVIEDPKSPDGADYCYEEIEATAQNVADALAVGCGVRIDLELKVGLYAHLATLCMIPARDKGVSVTLKLESSVLDAIYNYDRSMQSVDDEAKRGLVKLCLGTTRAARARGFLLVRAESRLSDINEDEILTEMHVLKRSWQIAAIASDRLSLAELMKSEETTDPDYVYSSTTGLTVYDLIHPMDDWD